MSGIAVIAGASGLCMAGFVTTCALWRRRTASALQRVRVERRGADLPGRSD